MEDAIALAARVHRGQRYSSPEGEPYIFHPLSVMLSLGDSADQIVAVLHDAVEDTTSSFGRQATRPELMVVGEPESDGAANVEEIFREEGRP